MFGTAHLLKKGDSKAEVVRDVVGGRVSGDSTDTVKMGSEW